MIVCDCCDDLITYQHGNKYFDSHDSKRDNNYNKNNDNNHDS